MILKKYWRNYFLTVGIVFIAYFGAAKWDYIAQNSLLYGAIRVVYYVCVFLLILAFAAVVGATMIEYLRASAEQDALLYYVDSKGFGINSDAGSTYSLKFFISWQELDAIEETRTFFILKSNKRLPYPICKRNLPADTVSAIREVLMQTPIRQKALLAG